MGGSNSRHSRRTSKNSAVFKLITLNASVFLHVDIMAMVNDWLLKLDRSRISRIADRPLKLIQSVLLNLTAMHVFAVLTIIVVIDLHVRT